MLRIARIAILTTVTILLAPCVPWFTLEAQGTDADYQRSALGWNEVEVLAIGAHQVVRCKDCFGDAQRQHALF